MGYFDRLQKKAGYFDADTGEYRWSAFTYTGSAAAGADYFVILVLIPKILLAVATE